MSEVPSDDVLRYRCNICGEPNEVPRQDFDREKPSCSKCGSSVRLRALALLIAEELAGAPLALPDLPVLKALEGIGMSDPDHLAAALDPKFRYVNTFYHKPPLFDILNPPPHSGYDFVISSEVLEHVPDPAAPAFRNLAGILKDDGVLLLTTPYSLADRHTEHFPQIQDFAVVELNGGWVLVHRKADGSIETRQDLVFHGGDGATLEMRVFTENELRRLLADAGFTHVRIAGENRPEFGIYQTDPWSLPIAARKKAPQPSPVYRELAGYYGETRQKLNNAQRDLAVLKEEYRHHVAWAEEKVRQLEDDLRQRAAWAQQVEADSEQQIAQSRAELETVRRALDTQEAEVEARTHWALGLQKDLEEANAVQQRTDAAFWVRLGRRLGLVGR